LTTAGLANPEAMWEACRTGAWDRPTAGICEEYVQANLVVLPHEDAFDFLRFCGRNPRACYELGQNRIEMRIPRSAWFLRDFRFSHS
jgi:uncharacterized protein YcsI (UPF0317 family)